MEITKGQIKYNITKRSGVISYIVIHDTGNKGKGADAKAHFNYFNGGNRNASADFFVDDKEIRQINDYTKYQTWHVGDGKGKYGITNSNSIGIEICVNSDGNYDRAFLNAVELTKYLMKELNIPLERVVRHYDASRKNCPASMSKSSWVLWKEFKAMLKEERKILETGNDIVWELMNGKYKIEISDVQRSVNALDKAKNNPAFSSLYWILHKLVNGNG